MTTKILYAKANYYLNDILEYVPCFEEIEVGLLDHHAEYMCVSAIQSSSPGMVNNFHSSVSSRPSLGLTQSPIQWVPSNGSLPGVKQQGREADRSPITVPRLRTREFINKLPRSHENVDLHINFPYVFHALCLIG
jgi:hypothetical protein